MTPVGLISEARDPDGQPVNLADPTGGTFTAAGDFDRLVPADDSNLPLLTALDPYGEWAVPHDRLPDLATEVSAIRPRSTDGPESRGLARLSAQIDE